jgi:hypothetical protein
LKIFQNRILKEIFEFNGEEVTGGSGKSPIEDLHNLLCSRNVKVTKSRKETRDGGVAISKR